MPWLSREATTRDLERSVRYAAAIMGGTVKRKIMVWGFPPFLGLKLTLWRRPRTGTTVTELGSRRMSCAFNSLMAISFMVFNSSYVVTMRERTSPIFRLARQRVSVCKNLWTKFTGSCRQTLQTKNTWCTWTHSSSSLADSSILSEVFSGRD